MPGLPVMAAGESGTPARAGERRIRQRVGNAMLFIAAVLVLSACAHQVAGTVSQDAEAPGFFSGIIHGLFFPIAWVFSLFADDIAIYAVPNDGGWYNFGYFIGITALGGGTLKWLED